MIFRCLCYRPLLKPLYPLPTMRKLAITDFQMLSYFRPSLEPAALKAAPLLLLLEVGLALCFRFFGPA
jgi:hypothetical protein